MLHVCVSTDIVFNIEYVCYMFGYRQLLCLIYGMFVKSVGMGRLFLLWGMFFRVIRDR